MAFITRLPVPSLRAVGALFDSAIHVVDDLLDHLCDLQCGYTFIHHRCQPVNKDYSSNTVSRKTFSNIGSNS
jgi:hypothetical protein